MPMGHSCGNAGAGAQECPQPVGAPPSFCQAHPAGHSAGADMALAPWLGEESDTAESWPTQLDLAEPMDIHDTDSDADLVEVSECVFEWVRRAHAMASDFAVK